MNTSTMSHELSILKWVTQKLRNKCVQKFKNDTYTRYFYYSLSYNQGMWTYLIELIILGYALLECTIFLHFASPR